MMLRLIVQMLWVACSMAMTTTAVIATPVHPTRDDEVVEVLPPVAGSRAEERLLRRQLAQRPRDPELALVVAKRYLAQAHALGDPRFAGLAMSAIDAWRDDPAVPDPLLLMRATLQQYLHEFDASASTLQQLLARPGSPRPQAWLTLATVRRVQGRYVDSDAACHQVRQSGALLHAQACLAENAALRGHVDEARAVFRNLLADARHPAETRAWLTTSVAELEQRAGEPQASEAAYREALQLDADPYTTLAYADLLIEQKRPAQALTLLKGQVRSDPVLLRLAIAGTQARVASAPADVAEMRERIALANERPDSKVFHGREQAMFALAVEGDAAKALDLARGDVAQQREPLDLLVLAQAARATGRGDALKEARALVDSIGLRDRRVEAAL